LRTAALAHAEMDLAAEGVEALTARRVAGGVGVSVGTLYNLFGHLDGLVRALNRRTMTRLHARLEAALQTGTHTGPGATPEARLTVLAEAYLSFAESEPAAWDTLFRHRLTTPPGPGEADADAGRFEGLLALLRRAAGDGPPDDGLIALWAAAHGVTELATSRRLPETDQVTARRYLAIIIQAACRQIMTDARHGER
ncbi:MAG: TetR-like C-terminal domain-containing protein, partial [Pseudomonadota bacterium]